MFEQLFIPLSSSSPGYILPCYKSTMYLATTHSSNTQNISRLKEMSFHTKISEVFFFFLNPCCLPLI